MINWKLITACVFLGASCLVHAGDKSKITVGGLVQVMASKDLYDNGGDNNIDQMYGRFIVTVKGQSDSHLGVIQLMGFPIGFGYSRVTGIDTNFAADYASMPKFLVWRATIESKGKPVDFRLGKQYHATSKAAVFGSFIDKGYGASALARVSRHNFLEFHKTVKGVGNTSVMLLPMDPNIYKGDLRIRQTIKPNKMTDMAIGYRSNVFDKIKNDDAVVVHNLVAQANANIAGYGPYVEFAIKGMGNEDANGKSIDATTPISFGLKFPIPGLNTFRLEAEYVSIDTPDGLSDDAKDVHRGENPLLWALYVDKKIGRYKHQFIAWTGTKADEVRFSWRLTAGF
jgi:hypothetical protein